MPTSFRVRLHEFTEIRAPATEVWDLLTDWAGMLRWHLTPEQGGLPGPPMIRCELVGEFDAVPRTRRMIFNNGRVIEEQIFYQSDEHRRIYYTKDEPPDSDLSGYVASAYVDEIDSNTCALHVTSWFDARTGDAAEVASIFFGNVYRAIFNGFRGYFARPNPFSR